MFKEVKEMNKELQKLAKQEGYIQGIAAKPGILSSVGVLKTMQQGLGFAFETIVGVYKDGYGQWKYPEKNLKEQARIVLGKLAKNPNYLEEKRAQYNQEFENVNKLFKRLYKAEGIPKEEL